MRQPSSSRRTFLMHSAATVAAASTLELSRSAFAGGSDTLKVGLVGCGGRGTGAAEQALTADKGTKLVAMADAFADRIGESLSALKGSPVAERVEVPTDKQYVGFDAFKNVIDQVDVVVLTSTPHFRPQHIAYAAEKGVHMFLEKPVATDSTGVRSVLASTEVAKKKNLAMVAGFCWRYHNPRRDTMKHALEGGAIGDIKAIETTYNSGGVWEPRKTRSETKSEMEYQMRNWYYYDWLSGDHIVEQAVHGIDTMGWAMGDKPPLLCWGSGGRQVRTDPIYGNIYDHFSIVYEYEGGVRGYHTCRHWRNTAQRTKDYVIGTKGTVDVFGGRITGEKTWKTKAPQNNMYQTEHDELFASIRAGKPINQGVHASHSTLLAIMGRMAAYTGSVVTWDAALNSSENLGPATYAWADAPVRPVPRPGITKLPEKTA